jgi:hypothetical protein
MARKFKCFHCKELIDSEPIKVSKTSKDGLKTVNKYIHMKCHEELLEKEAFLKQEKLELDELCTFVKRVHNISFSLPKRFFYYLQDVRNGTVRGKHGEKKYKDGIEYNVVKKAYELAKNDIEYTILSKNFIKVEDEIMYCFAIARERINDIMRSEQQKTESRKVAEAKEIQMFGFEEQETTGYKKTDTDDLSFLLGDE